MIMTEELARKIAKVLEDYPEIRDGVLEEIKDIYEVIVGNKPFSKKM